MVLATGWAWDHVEDTVTFQRLAAFQKIWEKSPPAHVSLTQISTMLMQFFGVEKKASPRPPSAKERPAFLDLPEFED